MNGHDFDPQSDSTARWDERLAEMVWPGVRQLTLESFNAGDVVVLCGGFEERASSLLERLIQGGRTDVIVVLVSYLPSYTENRYDDLHTVASNAGMEVRRCVYDRRSPAGGGERVVECVRGASHVHVDISGMSRLLIVQLVVALTQAGLPVTVAYGEAAQYSPTEEEFRNRFESLSGEATLDFLSSGVFEVAATPELGSVAMLGEGTRLVVFPSLEAVQLKNVLQEVQPTYVDVIYGLPPAKENEWRRVAAEEINRGALRRQVGVTMHETSTFDYRETIGALLRIYADRSVFDRILVAPTGSKMQAVAVGLVRSVLTDIQVVYPTPQRLMTSAYTSGLRQMHQFPIPTIEAAR